MSATRTTRQQARTAGLLYLLMILIGTPGLLLVPGSLVVHGDAAATAQHVRASELLFRAGIASQLLGQVMYVFAGLALYRLFENVSRTLALQMLVLLLVSVPIACLNVVNEIAALVVVGAPPFLSALTLAQHDALAYLFIRLYGEGIGVVWIFWGLWLAPYGLLVMRSGFLPKVLGVLLLLAVPGDLLRAVTSLFPAIEHPFLDRLAGLLALGELPIVLWLVIAGAKDAPAPSEPAA
jgi:hypothetical protein